MEKELFVKTIEALKKQRNYDIAFGKNMGKCFPNAFEANLLPNNDILSNSIIEILECAMDDKKEGYHSWISWFCYETDFGEENLRLKAYDKNNKEILMRDAGDLFDYLDSIKNKK